MIMIPREKLKADKIYTLFFTRRTDALPINEVIASLGSHDAKRVFRLLSELAKKNIIGLDMNHNIYIRNHFVLLQKVLGLRYEASATFLFVAIKCHNTMINRYLKARLEGKEIDNVTINVDTVWSLAMDLYNKHYNKQTKRNAIVTLIKRGYLINCTYSTYKSYALNLDMIMKDNILDYIKSVNGNYT